MIRKVLKSIAHHRTVGPALLLPYRAILAMKYVLRPMRDVFSWLFNSRETTNFTYELENKNRRYLAHFLSIITHVDAKTALRYIDELEGDEALRNALKERSEESYRRGTTDNTIYYGRRVGWYALARILKPRNILETGIDKGLGARVLITALEKNGAEGYPGKYYGTELNPHAGELLDQSSGAYGQILYGDSIESISRLTEEIDLFINDSDHSSEYEEREYEAVSRILSDSAYLIGDNAHATDKLLRFAERSGRSFLFFSEEPKNHWYPGGGIGVAFNR